jgi:putative flavoprotein involved in K+ transport
VWGLDADGELGNMFKRTPQQGLWFIAGGLPHVRINSKYLALQIKAAELGILGPLEAGRTAVSAQRAGAALLAEEAPSDN